MHANHFIHNFQETLADLNIFVFINVLKEVQISTYKRTLL